MVDHGFIILGISLEAILAFRKNMLAMGYPKQITEEMVDGFFNGKTYEDKEQWDMD
jgi:hypothetical protein